MGPSDGAEPLEHERDPLLRAFLVAGSEAEAEAELETLLQSVAQPVALRVARARLRAGAGEEEDVASEVLIQIVTRLKQLKARAEGPGIADFRSYVATAARNACHDHLRARHPRRFRLKSRVRYALTHQPGFAVWPGSADETLCGFSAWRAASSRALPRALNRLREEPGSLAGAAVPERLTDLLAALFDRLGGAVELEELVDAVASILGIRDLPPAEVSELEDEAGDGVDALSSLDASAGLKRLWDEIAALPARQRAALLLNLRDPEGRDTIALLPLTGTASVREIAASVEIPAERFAALWPELPLEDAAIAELLGLTRQQVINLRKCAKERLARRLRPASGPAEARR